MNVLKRTLILKALIVFTVRQESSRIQGKSPKQLNYIELSLSLMITQAALR